MQSLRFESEPLGAEVHTLGGQTCKTPCELMVMNQEDLFKQKAIDERLVDENRKERGLSNQARPAEVAHHHIVQ